MRSTTTGARLAIPILMALAVTLFAAFRLAQTSASHGGMDAMSIDMDPSAAPANTAASLGTRQDCARINENGILDADEDAVDTVQFDVTALNIPAANAIVAFGYGLDYDESALSMQTADNALLPIVGPGSVLLNANGPLPDGDDNNSWIGAATDTGPVSAYESGSGVLSRLTISSDSGAPAGTYPLTLRSGDSAHIDPANQVRFPHTLENASVAIDSACPPPPPGVEVSIDMDISGNTPTTTLTSPAPVPHIEVLGTRETCAKVVANGIQDFDEDGVDLIGIDVTIENVPSPGMTGFGLALLYEDSNLTVTAHNPGMILNSLSGSSNFDPGFDSLEGDDRSDLSGTDLSGGGSAEAGGGVLDRVSVAVDFGVTAGVYPISISPVDTGYIDPFNQVISAAATNDATIAIGTDCPGTPTPSPTPSPSPTPPPLCNGLPATIVGTAGANTLIGTPGDDVIVALGGGDTIEGRGGNDTICGGIGQDVVSGGAGVDTIRGEGGNDDLAGNGGADALFGGPGTDTCDGGVGVDTGQGCETSRRIP